MNFPIRNRRDFGIFLESYRLQRGLYQYQIAEKIGIDKAYYNRLAKGKMNLSLDRMFSILKKIDHNLVLEDNLPF